MLTTTKKRKTAQVFLQNLENNVYMQHTAARHHRLIGGCICCACYSSVAAGIPNKLSYDFRTVQDHCKKNGVHADVICMADNDLQEAFIASFANALQIRCNDDQQPPLAVSDEEEKKTNQENDDDNHRYFILD
jgi:hypothetical protein